MAFFDLNEQEERSVLGVVRYTVLEGPRISDQEKKWISGPIRTLDASAKKLALLAD